MSRGAVAGLSVCLLLSACTGAASTSASPAPPSTSDPTPSPHLPGRLLFLNDGREQPEWTLWTTLPGSTDSVQIVHSKFNIWSPAISPDGTRIGFDRSRGPHRSDVLVFARPDGSHQRAVPSLCGNSCTFFDEMVWAPDGQTVLVLMATGVRPHLTGAIWSIRVDGTHRRQLTFPGPSDSLGGFDDHHPSVAPDGASFVFDRIDEGTGQHSTEIAPIDGGTPVVVPIPRRLNPGDPTWTPDGSQDPLPVATRTHGRTCAEPLHDPPGRNRPSADHALSRCSGGSRWRLPSELLTRW